MPSHTTIARSSFKNLEIPKPILDYAIIAVQLGFLLIVLKANRKIGYLFPQLWFAVPLLLSALLCRANISLAERPLARLWQLVGVLSALYSLLHYPLMPVVGDGRGPELAYILLFSFWIISILSGVFCFRIPSLSLLAPSFLVWGNSIAAYITGLPTTTDLDIMPLAEVSLCIGLGLLINQVSRPLVLRFSAQSEASADNHPDRAPQFAHLVLLLAIAVHLANYFWSFIAKMTLDGSPFAWLTQNNAAYLFLAALDDNHIIFGGYPSIVQLVYKLTDSLHVVSNLWVLLCQGAAITAFFLPKRLFLILLLMFDVMHLSIIVVAGANFWPWIILNLIIAYVVARPDFQYQSRILCAIATIFVVVAIRHVNVAGLGWYDTGANNRLFIEAIDDAGKLYPVPTNFFAFYSYSFGHMDYGPPNPASAVGVASPNGGTLSYRTFRAGRTCDIGELRRDGANPNPYLERLSGFVLGYHKLMLAVEKHFGSFPYDYYPHHFYVPPGEGDAFFSLDKRQVVAYLYKQESGCLAFEDGHLKKTVVGSGVYRIDVGHDVPTQPIK
jgi:hypothetical protein